MESYTDAQLRLAFESTKMFINCIKNFEAENGVKCIDRNAESLWPEMDADSLHRSVQQHQPNLLEPFQGLQPTVAGSELELSKRMEAATSLMLNPYTSNEEFERHSMEAVTALAKRMREIDFPAKVEGTKSPSMKPTSRTEPNITLPLVTPRSGFLHSAPPIDYTIPSMKLPTTTSLRLLKVNLLDRTDSQTDMYEPITCTMSVANLNDSPVYCALSYSWGDPRETYPSLGDMLDRQAWDNWCWTIRCNSRPTAVNTNLYTALIALRWKMSSDLETMPRDIAIWIDALCINQNDTVEKGHQVRLMTRIYSEAESVYVWLGGEDCYTEHAIDVLKTLSASNEKLSDTDFRMLEMHQSQIARGTTYDYLPVRAISAAEWLGLYAFLTRSWFSRIWIIQEFVMAKKVTFICGLRDLPPDWIKNTIRFLARTGWSEVLRPILYETEPLEYRPEGRRHVKLRSFSDYNVENQESAHRYIENNAQTISHFGIFDQLFDTDRTRSGSHKGCTQSPLWLNLQLLRLQRATDPRDKIYAVLGISIEFEDDRTALLDRIPIDYTKSVQDVFIDATRFAITRSLILDILCLKEARSVIHRLPSWVPDFSVESFPYVLSNETWNACGPCMRPVGRVLPGNTLEVIGASIGKIKATSLFPRTDQYYDFPELNSFIANLPFRTEILIYDGNARKDYFDMVFRHRTGSSQRYLPLRPVMQQRGEVFWRTLLCDTDPYDLKSARPLPNSYGSIVLKQTLQDALYHRLFSAGLSEMRLSQEELSMMSTKPSWGIYDPDIVRGIFTHVRDPETEWLKVEKLFTFIRFIHENYTGPTLSPPEATAIRVELEGVTDGTKRRELLEAFVTQCAKSCSAQFDHPKSSELHKAMGEICHGRKLFTSNRGSLGWAHETAEPGDEIWILARCRKPLILRRVGDEYRLIGEAYVHGMMQGQVFVYDSTGKGTRAASALETIKII